MQYADAVHRDREIRQQIGHYSAASQWADHPPTQEPESTSMPARLQYAPSQTATRSRRRSAGSSLLAPGRCPASTSAWRTHLRSDSAVAMPSFAATDQIAAYSVTYSPRCSITKRTARSRSSLGYGFGMKIILPRKEVYTEPGAVHWEQALVRYTKIGFQSGVLSRKFGHPHRLRAGAEACRRLVSEGWHRRLGARPMRNVVERRVRAALVDSQLRGALGPGVRESVLLADGRDGIRVALARAPVVL